MGDDISSQFTNLTVGEPKYIMSFFGFFSSLILRRHNLYKTKGENSQKKRRDDYLQNLKSKRRDLTQYARALALDAPIPDAPGMKRE